MALSSRNVVRTRRTAYRSLVDHGMGKRKAVNIANAGRTFAGRSRMAKKGWNTRRSRGR